MNDPRRSRARKRLRTLAVAAVGVIAAAAAVRFASFVAASAVRPSACFVTHYTLAHLLAEGKDLASSYDDPWFEAQTALVTPGVTDINVNPPTTALLLLPLAALSYTGARIAWTAVSVVLLAVSIVWLVREAALPGAWGLAFVGFALTYQPVIADFRFANAYVLVLALTVAAWHGYRTGNDRLLGAALALMLAVKLAGGLLWLLALSERRWRAVAWGAAVAASIAVGSLPWLGVHAWRADAGALASAVRRPESAVTAYQSVSGFFRHLFAPDPAWNPAPLFSAPALASLGGWVALLAVIGAGLWVARSHPGDDRVFAAFVIAGVVISPMSLDYTYSALLLPAAVALAWVRERGSPWTWVLVFAAVLPIAAYLPYWSPRLANGAWALLAYPKLGGALFSGGNQQTYRVAYLFLRHTDARIGNQPGQHQR